MKVLCTISSIVLASIASTRCVRANCAGYSVEIFAGPDCSFGHSFSHATGIAENGAICGSYLDCGEVGHHVIWWPDGNVTELPPSADGGIPDSPFALNSAGQVAGRMHVPGLNPPNRAFLYSDGITSNLGALPKHDWAQALAINSDSIVVGSSHDPRFGPTAFVSSNGTMMALPLTYGNFSDAVDISDSGMVCGRMGTDLSTDTHAFIFDLATGNVDDLGVILKGATASEATGINNAAIICGRSRFPCGDLCSNFHGFIWSNGKAQDLGVLPGKTHTRPQAINDSNVIVGFCDPGGAKAFVWRNGTMTALNDLIPQELNLAMTIAWDINNSGQIVGEAVDLATSDAVAVRLTPIPSPIGDSDCDGDIDTDDLLGVINNWAHESPKGSTALPPCDFDHDGAVELDDLMIVVDNWSAK